MGDAHEYVGRETGDEAWRPPLWVDFPPDFVPVSEPLAPDTDRRLGYVGERRFVIFRYEFRAEEVIWDDGRTYGFGAGGWCVFLDRIAPLAKRYGVDLGMGGSDVLLLDRTMGSAYFASRENAEQFLRRQIGAEA